jgi:tripartite-type tricarboxylate transporter receptor subunit TctC
MVGEDRMKILRRAFIGVLAAAAAAMLSPHPAAAVFPDRPVTLIVPWAAGGGTDAIARTLGALLERDLKQPVNVVNRTGGNGVVGHSAIAQAAPDGYTIGLITLEINMMHWVGHTDLTYEAYTPLALINADPAAIHVRADSPYKSLKDLLAAIKANPGKLKASGTGQGGSWHLALAGMLRSEGIEASAVGWVPSTGAATALQDLAAGGVDFVSCSLPEARALIDAGRVRSLALMAEKRAGLLPSLPTLAEATGSNWTKGVWRGMVGPKGMPKDIAARYEEAIKKAYESKDFQESLTSRGFEPVWADSVKFAQFMKDDNKEIGEVLKAIGLAK